jgi:hypothetical protein
MKEGSILILTPKYGYFPMASFLLLWDRQKNVRWFVDKYTEALAKYPNAQKISFIGHSNGTYLLASALERYDSTKFHNIYFAGSVVRKKFRWDVMIGERVNKFRNDMAASDWVVAFFPHLFELIRMLPFLGDSKFFDVGSGGFHGFEENKGNENEVKYFDGGHGVALGSSSNIESILDFILDKKWKANRDMKKKLKLLDNANSVILFLSNITWLIWLALIAILVGGGKAILKFAPTHKIFGPKFFVTTYVGVILLLLYTI